MAANKIQFEKVYAQLSSLIENSKDLIAIFEILDNSVPRTPDEIIGKKMRMARIDNQIRGINVQFNNLWQAYMEGLTNVSETFIDEAKRKEKENSGFKKFVRKMASRPSLR